MITARDESFSANVDGDGEQSEHRPSIPGAGESLESEPSFVGEMNQEALYNSTPCRTPNPSDTQPGSRTTSDLEPIRDLHQLCREGRLYAVEEWIRDGKPLQLAEEADTPRGRWSTALEIALDRGDHVLTHLLLCNGYDPNLEPWSPLDAALPAKPFDPLGWGLVGAARVI